MKKNRAVFHPEAEDEFLAAIEYYALKNLTLGERFEVEIHRLVTQIEERPGRHGPWRHGTRRARARRFPYLVVFAERPSGVRILAVAHKKQHPDYWMSRLA